MKAISVRQPFAHMILCVEKEYEYRTWSTDYRGELLICSSASPKVAGTKSGYALCIVNITDVSRVTWRNFRKFGLDTPPLIKEKLYAWKLEDVRVVDPFPVKGKLNFYYVDDELIHVKKNKSEQEH